MREPQGISGRTRKLFAGELTLPDANKYTQLLDTTQQLPAINETAPAKVAAIPTVGATRNQALGRWFCLAISCTGQDVTVLRYGMNGAGAWALFASTVITAGAADQTITWDPSAYGFTDALIIVLGGATPPTKIYASLTERTVA